MNKRARAAAGALVAFLAGVRLRASAPDDPGRGETPATAADPSGAASTSFDAVRQHAKDAGITPSFVYDGEGVVNARGGERTGAVYLGTFHMLLTLDASRLLGWKGATFRFDGLVTHGGHPTDLVGDAQGVSNLEAPAQAQLYEAWLQQNFFGNQLSALVGRYDLSSEFYRLQSAALFLNGSFGTGPEFSTSGAAGPSVFPDASVGIRVAWKPVQALILRAAVLDGVPVHRPDGEDRLFARGDGALLVGEVAFLNRPAPPDAPMSRRFRIGRGASLAPYDDKVAIGGWYYTAEFDDLSDRLPDGRPVRHRGSGGAYALADGLLYRSAGPSPRRLSGFVQVGIGDSRVDRFGFYAGGGLVLSGLIPGLQNDELGLAVASARNGSHFLDEQENEGLAATHTETAVELTYLVQWGDHVAIQPDVQYVMRPGTVPARRDALVIALHFELSF